MVLTVSFALSPVTGLSCHRRSRGNNFQQELDASVGATSARFPKFVTPAAISFHELRKAMGTGKFKIPVPLSI
jgi:hypothetical protein